MVCLGYNKEYRGIFSHVSFFLCRLSFAVAGVQDTRFQALMPDPLHFLGVTKIDNFISMSDMK
jgi:hypothetical protein